MTDLSGYVLEMLHDDGDLVLYRGRQPGNLSPVLVLAPVATAPTTRAVIGPLRNTTSRPDLTFWS